MEKGRKAAIHLFQLIFSLLPTGEIQ
uniref:Uncharacterized protein n=1 Tax=Anguilla anguilla TaxID=7936 RepID=A0A0E9Q5G9_ANGAN